MKAFLFFMIAVAVFITAILWPLVTNVAFFVILLLALGAWGFLIGIVLEDIINREKEK